MGSVFSPYYAWAGRRDALDHCAINVALYGSPSRWTMTERGKEAVERTPDRFRVGPSSAVWDGDGLTLEIDEVAIPLPRRVRGTVRVRPEAVTDRAIQLDSGGRHHWWPIAPRSRIEVTLENPALRWSGVAYLDSNVGTEPLENAFAHWTWARAGTRKGAAVVYDVEETNGSRHGLALRFTADGEAERMLSPALAPLPRSRWGLRQATRSDSGEARVRQRLEDAPFYARSLVEGALFGEPVTMVHETLSLTRFKSPVVKLMLPFRMPRRRR